MQEYATDKPPQPLRMALRNPSDALQILACSQDDSPVSTRSSIAYSDTTGRLAPQASSLEHSTTHGNRPTPSFILDNYDLVKRGLLHSSILPELLHIYAKNYHPYCPIVPEYFLGSSALEKVQRPDYFLLTIILTIASRDSPNHVLVHRYCWDHTQHLLLQVLLAHSWSQTPRTVEGLILLSEWLPHIQANRSTEANKSLSSEDRTAWSLVGLAVRLGYLLRLDTAAFRNSVDDESKEQEERKRLVWIFVYLLDRQISVRLGHSFWSRGPALSSHFTEKDFPSLKSTSGINHQSYAAVLEANLELTQLIYNAHQILYPSTDKTITMIHNGDYPIYLDDFDRSITTWHAKWKDIEAPINVKTSLMLTYEYTRLYVNAFSFQAVVIRKSTPRSSSQPGNRQPHPDQFAHGIMSLPDGKYVFDATQAAKSLLGLFTRLEPRRASCYLPSRFHLYGVYAAVFLHKTKSAGVFQSAAEKQEVTNLVLQFISIMKEAPLVETHVCHGYSVMLKRLWCPDDGVNSSQGQHSPGMGQNATSQGMAQQRDIEINVDSSSASHEPEMQQESGQDRFNSFFNHGGLECIGEEFWLGNDGQLPSVEEYLLGSFWPGITGFEIDNESRPGDQNEIQPMMGGI
ncbi:hypothetical protein FVEN_g7758 [Fusarium venenatum]|uniref:Xylanolytic transcriptional activator regulatory domain-containing protein n=2 Tax=Fusarium venenatum TaxID=56646 RepID=A0A2L2TDC9_9HYPO|nr:uncharacterized protein FVRRES_08046 [Fusarium venenatum]KAG8354317.1 hypothetical protein FVEN_g7758 [Fusarium venenatum]CEI67969.1 unnamed protein product [Fusarium venenatum]